MFDIGFFEIVLIAIIALVVLGPERLPHALRTLGLWVGRIKRSFNAIKDEVDRELQLEEMRKELKQHTETLKQQAEATEEIKTTLDDSKAQMTEILKEPANQPADNSMNKVTEDKNND